jgi:hypothetical protein
MRVCPYRDPHAVVEEEDKGTRQKTKIKRQKQKGLFANRAFAFCLLPLNSCLS